MPESGGVWTANKRVRILFLGWGAVLLAVVGCGTPQAAKYSPTEARLSKLGLSYGLYSGEHQGAPPSRIEDLRRYVAASIKPEQLAALGASNAEELFTSARDGKLFEMVAYHRLPSASGQPPVVLYESVGVNGKRFVSYLGGGVEEVDSERFQALVPPTKKN